MALSLPPPPPPLRRAQEIRNLLDSATVVREDRTQWASNEIESCLGQAEVLLDGGVPARTEPRL